MTATTITKRRLADCCAQVVYQGEQEMLQRRILVLSVIGFGESAVQRQFKFAGKVGLWLLKSFGGYTRRQGGVMARSRHLRANRGAERISIIW
jgi:hypothetical protein